MSTRSDDVLVLHVYNGNTTTVKEATIATNSTTTRIQMVKDTLSTREVVADHENCSDESHISKAQEFSAI